MGRWTQRARSSRAVHLGTLPPPGDSDWTLTSPGPHYIRFTLLTGFPPPATAWQERYRYLGLTAWVTRTPSSGSPDTYSYAPGGATAEAQTCWWDTTHQLSDWSRTKTVYIP
jgi:hypothetical protein